VRHQEIIEEFVESGRKPANMPVQTPTKYLLTIYAADIVACRVEEVI
jgi:hypothetical protein